MYKSNIPLIYEKMEYVNNIKSGWVFSMSDKARNTIFVMVKTFLDIIRDYGSQEIWHDLEVPLAIQGEVGTKTIEIYKNKKGDITVNKKAMPNG